MPPGSSITTDDFTAAFDSFGEAAIIIDRFGIIVAANRVALDTLGYEYSDFVGKWFLNKIQGLSIDRKKLTPLDRPIIKCLLSGQTIREYLYYHGKKQVMTPVFISASPIIKDGAPIGVSAVFRDISLEEAVDQMKSEFISLASHQLRTPLASIKTYSHMLLEGFMGPVDDAKRPALETIVSATNRMNELISTLLNISRLESGAIVLDVGPVDLAKIIKELIDDMAILAKSRSITVKTIVRSKGRAVIYSDGPIIKEVLSNLISNSIKYSKDKGIVNISINAVDNGITIIVKDNGFGIPDPAKSQIFSKFFRANNIIRLETNGTGLGLYLVKGLVEELGGKISFSSKEDRGTSFKLKLPKRIPTK